MSAMAMCRQRSGYFRFADKLRIELLSRDAAQSVTHRMPTSIPRDCAIVSADWQQCNDFRDELRIEIPGFRSHEGCFAAVPSHLWS